GRFTGSAVVVRWAAGRIIIDRLIHVIARVPVTTPTVVRWVVGRLLWRVGTSGRLPNSSRRHDRFGSCYGLPVVVARNRCFVCARYFVRGRSAERRVGQWA